MGAKGSKKNTPQKPPKLSSKDKKFLMKQTGYSADGVVELFNEFHANNPDAVMDKAEFCRFYDKLRPEPAEIIDEIATKIFRCFDTDNNGTITFTEFMLAYAMTCRGDPEEKLAYAFEIYDVDENGTLNRDELVNIIDAMLDMLGADDSMSTQDLADSCFAQCDDSGDGTITKEEFVKNCLESPSLRSVMSPFN